MYPLRNLFDNVTNLSMSTRAGSEIVTQSPRICIQPHMRILSTEGYQLLKRKGLFHRTNGPISNAILPLSCHARYKHLKIMQVLCETCLYHAMDNIICFISYGTYHNDDNMNRSQKMYNNVFSNQ